MPGANANFRNTGTNVLPDASGSLDHSSGNVGFVTPGTGGPLALTCGTTTAGTVTPPWKALWRTGDVIKNQRYYAQLCYLQVDGTGPLEIEVTSTAFTPFVTVSRDIGNYWQSTDGSGLLIIDVTADLLGEFTIEVTTTTPHASGAFSVRIGCVTCPYAGGAAYTLPAEISYNLVDSHLDRNSMGQLAAIDDGDGETARFAVMGDNDAVNALTIKTWASGSLVTLRHLTAPGSGWSKCWTLHSFFEPVSKKIIAMMCFATYSGGWVYNNKIGFFSPTTGLLSSIDVTTIEGGLAPQYAWFTLIREQAGKVMFHTEYGDTWILDAVNETIEAHFTVSGSHVASYSCLEVKGITCQSGTLRLFSLTDGTLDETQFTARGVYPVYLDSTRDVVSLGGDYYNPTIVVTNTADAEDVFSVPFPANIYVQTSGATPFALYSYKLDRLIVRIFNDDIYDTGVMLLDPSDIHDNVMNPEYVYFGRSESIKQSACGVAEDKGTLYQVIAERYTSCLKPTLT